MDMVVEICVAVIIVAIIAAVVIVLCNAAARKTVTEIAIKFITEAEEKFGGGTGELKLQYAIAGIVSTIPKFLTVFFPTSKIVAIINEQVDKFNEFMKEKDLTIVKIPDYMKNTDIDFVEPSVETPKPIDPSNTEEPGAM